MHQKMATLGIWRKCMLTKLRGILRGRAPTQGAMRDFLDAAKRLRPGDIAIDCGANVGRFTRPIAEGGATVHAFEPNPDAFAALLRNLAGLAWVQLHPQGRAARPGGGEPILNQVCGTAPKPT